MRIHFIQSRTYRKAFTNRSAPSQVWIKENNSFFMKRHLPSNPLAGLRERSESSRNTVLGRCFLTPRTVVGFWRSALSRSSMILSWWRHSYSCLVKVPRRCWDPSGGGVCAAGGVRAGGGVEGVRGRSSSSTELRLLWDGRSHSDWQVREQGCNSVVPYLINYEGIIYYSSVHQSKSGHFFIIHTNIHWKKQKNKNIY